MSERSATSSGRSIRKKNPGPISHIYFKQMTPCNRVNPNSWRTDSVSACPESACLYLTIEPINEFTNLPLVSFTRQLNSSKSILLSYHLQLRLQTIFKQQSSEQNSVHILRITKPWVKLPSLNEQKSIFVFLISFSGDIQWTGTSPTAELVSVSKKVSVPDTHYSLIVPAGYALLVLSCCSFLPPAVGWAVEYSEQWRLSYKSQLLWPGWVSSSDSWQVYGLANLSLARLCGYSFPSHI